MSTIDLSNVKASGYITGEAKGMLLQITNVDYKAKFNKLVITLTNEDGESIQNRFNNLKDEKVLSILKTFAGKVLPKDQVDHLDVNSLLHKFVIADIVASDPVASTREGEEGKEIVFYNPKNFQKTTMTFGGKKSVINEDGDEEVLNITSDDLPF